MKSIASLTFLFAFIPAAFGSLIFSENFDDVLGSEWTQVDSGGNVDFTVANGVATIGLLDSATMTGGQTAYIEYTFDNSTDQFIGYRGSFVVDFTNMSFTTDATTGNNAINLFELFPTSGNNRMVGLSFEMREWNNDYAFVSRNGVQFNAGGNNVGTQSIATGTLEGLSEVMFEFEITFQNNGGLNWTINSDWTFTDVSTDTLLGTINSNITRDAANGDFDPLSGSNERFRIGAIGTTSQFTVPNVTGNIAVDDFTVTGIPEPSFYAVLLGAGTFGLILWSRRRK